MNLRFLRKYSKNIISDRAAGFALLNQTKLAFGKVFSRDVIDLLRDVTSQLPDVIEYSPRGVVDKARELLQVQMIYPSTADGMIYAVLFIIQVKI